MSFGNELLEPVCELWDPVCSLTNIRLEEEEHFAVFCFCFWLPDEKHLLLLPEEDLLLMAERKRIPHNPDLFAMQHLSLVTTSKSSQAQAEVAMPANEHIGRWGG